MKTITGFALVLSLLVLGACGDSAESLKDDMKGEMNNLVDALKDVKDADSAKAAKSEIEAIFERMKEIKKRHDELPEEEKKKLMEVTEEDREQMQAIQKEMMELSKRLMANPAALLEITSVMKENPLDK